MPAASSGRGGRESRIIEEGAIRLGCPDDGLDMNHRRTAIDGEFQGSRERPDGEPANADGGAARLPRDLGRAQVERRSITLKRAFRGRIEEDVEDAHRRRPVRRAFATADRQEVDRVNVFEDDGVANPETLDQRPARSQVEAQDARLVATRRPGDDDGRSSACTASCFFSRARVSQRQNERKHSDAERCGHRETRFTRGICRTWNSSQIARGAAGVQESSDSARLLRAYRPGDDQIVKLV